MSTQISVADQKVNSIRTLLENNKAALFSAVPKHLTADRMIRVACTELRKNPSLAECDQRSLIGAIVEASQLGLEIGGVLGQAYLVPYNVKVKGTNGAPDRWMKVVQLIPGYKGLIDIARRSGQISTIQVRVVHSKDEFDFEFGLEPRLRHKPSLDQDPGHAQYVYAIANLRDGGTQLEVMTVREVESVRSRSKSKDSGPWVTDWEEMAKKTALRRLCKLLPVSVEMQRAVAIDEEDDRFRKPVNLGADLAIALPPAVDMEPEIIETTAEVSGAPTGGTTQQVAEKISRRKKSVEDPKGTEARDAQPSDQGAYQRFLGYISELRDVADAELLNKEISDAVNAGAIDAQQAQSLANKLEIQVAIIRG